MSSKLSRGVLIGISIVGVMASLTMILVGLPEANPTQTALLELSSLPLSVAALAAVVLLWQWAGSPIGPRSRRILRGALAGAGLGLVLMALAYLTGPRQLVHTGQLVIWLSVFLVLVVLFRRPRRLPRPGFGPIEFAAEDEEPPKTD